MNIIRKHNEDMATCRWTSSTSYLRETFGHMLPNKASRFDGSANKMLKTGNGKTPWRMKTCKYDRYIQRQQTTMQKMYQITELCSHWNACRNSFNSMFTHKLILQWNRKFHISSYFLQKPSNTDSFRRNQRWNESRRRETVCGMQRMRLNDICDSTWYHKGLQYC